MNRLFRSLFTKNAATRYKIVAISDNEIDEVMQRGSSKNDANDDDFILPMISSSSNNNKTNAENEQQSNSRLLSGRHQTAPSNMMQSPREVDDDAVATNEVGAGDEEDLMLMHQNDPEWIAKLEEDLAQAARLEEDLQMLCALRKTAPADLDGSKGDELLMLGDYGDEYMPRKNASKDGLARKTEPNSHHNSKALDSLKVEGKNSFGIPCTDVYGDDFEDELNFLLRNHRHSRYPRNFGIEQPQQPPSHLFLSGTSLGKKRLIAISSQVPMRQREDNGIIRDVQSPLFADVTPVKSRSTSVVPPMSSRKKTSPSLPLNNNDATSSVVSMALTSSSHHPPPSTAHTVQNNNAALPVTHNSQRTSMLGGPLLGKKPNKKMFRASLPVNDETTALQVQVACNSNSVLALDAKQTGTHDCCTGPIDRCSMGCPRVAAKTVVPRMWVSPSWPIKPMNGAKTLQPFKQVNSRRVQRIAGMIPLDPSHVPGYASHRSSTSSDNHHNHKATAELVLQKSSQNYLHSTTHHAPLNANLGDFGELEDAYDVAGYWSRHGGGKVVKTAPSFERQSTQMSLGSILSAIRSANETLAFAK